ncbi:MAG TPA: 7TM-DISM domain-containing protein, partial [Spirochaetota bacterium]|nr:7TM-DISM domain-containing protein [Spirochaetota bacterium]
FICEIGKVGDSKAETKPIHKMQVVPFRSKNSDLTILIQVSNYSLQSGGFWKSVEIGNIKTVDKRIASLCAKSFTIFGVLILFAFYHIFLFILNFKNKSALFFSLICLSYAVRIIVSDEKALTIIFPSFNFDLLIRLEYLSLYLSILFFPMFFRAIFPKESNFYTLLISSVFLTALSILTLVLPLERINFTLNLFYVVGIFTFICLLIFLISSVRRKRTGALLFLSVSILFALTALNDSLSAMLIINTPFFLPLGFIIFMAGQSFVIATIFNEALVTSQKLKKEIENKNIELEEKVVERTQNLQEANKKLSVALSEIKTLRGFLPICSGCKKIRDENGEWEHIENYVKKNSTADFTHSMCPDCMKKFYPGV